MKRLILLLMLASAVTACGLAGHEINDNPKITPTSKTGVTSVKGSNVYEKIPETPRPAQP